MIFMELQARIYRYHILASTFTTVWSHMFKEILESFESLRYWFKSVYRNNKEEPERNFSFILFFEVYFYNTLLTYLILREGTMYQIQWKSNKTHWVKELLVCHQDDNSHFILRITLGKKIYSVWTSGKIRMWEILSCWRLLESSVSNFHGLARCIQVTHKPHFHPLN